MPGSFSLTSHIDLAVNGIIFVSPRTCGNSEILRSLLRARLAKSSSKTCKSSSGYADCKLSLGDMCFMFPRQSSLKTFQGLGNRDADHVCGPSDQAT